MRISTESLPLKKDLKNRFNFFLFFFKDVHIINVLKGFSKKFRFFQLFRLKRASKFSHIPLAPLLFLAIFNSAPGFDSEAERDSKGGKGNVGELRK